ncbi:MAG: hypothetical protein ACI4S9_07365 [Christensenellales bacterium]
MEKEREIAEATRLKEKYLTREEKTTKIEELRELDRKVSKPATVASCIIGAVGALIMGAGMAGIMSWNNFALGLGMGIPGLVICLLTYPIYKTILKKQKAKYSERIISLSNEIIGE